MDRLKPQERFRKHTFDNGSTSLEDLLLGDTMHSRIGPFKEATELYASALDFFDQPKLCLWDIGMGTAANVIATLHQCAQLAKQKELRVISFELFPEGLMTALENLDEFPFLSKWGSTLQCLLKNQSVQFELSSQTQVTWELHTHDFKEIELNTLPSPDLIFYDFYTPNKFPELWSAEIFRKLYSKSSHKPHHLVTYASSTFVRLNLLQAGYFVSEWKSTEAKRQTTLATSTVPSNPLKLEWLTRKLGSHAALQLSEAQKNSLISHPQFNYLNKKK